MFILQLQQGSSEINPKKKVTLAPLKSKRCNGDPQYQIKQKMIEEIRKKKQQRVNEFNDLQNIHSIQYTERYVRQYYKFDEKKSKLKQKALSCSNNKCSFMSISKVVDLPSIIDWKRENKLITPECSDNGDFTRYVRKQIIKNGQKSFDQ
ncbi:unnamed protein product [Paramecium sonneborni]|uniref:Uncharacterized protein n=1 Tax=Paramecium sonneborni TaxID=65129 RepID=A0A8S1RNF4_9CILI|nr:unnamed protein product [Paramecium sonneborni]